VLAHFDLPADPTAPPEFAPVRQNIDVLWKRLTRDTPTTAPYSSLPPPQSYFEPADFPRQVKHDLFSTLGNATYRNRLYSRFA
jgi:hypothetical protein